MIVVIMFIGMIVLALFGIYFERKLKDAERTSNIRFHELHEQKRNNNYLLIEIQKLEDQINVLKSSHLKTFSCVKGNRCDESKIYLRCNVVKEKE